ncbi:hypothetical protein CTI12_AA547120 [Artemisia annua]|uniref:Uncharacterized protein n=1 Tax=Artemisia annua TaxID=35608 RepID=A0A2U1KU75_ARTAN|nr:hypothetical protein CTI12_AA547120 [Artemisia annua]
MDDNDADDAMLEQYIMKEVTVEVPTKEPIKNSVQNQVSDPEDNLKDTSTEEALKIVSLLLFFRTTTSSKAVETKGIFYYVISHVIEHMKLQKTESNQTKKTGTKAEKREEVTQKQQQAKEKANYDIKKDKEEANET